MVGLVMTVVAMLGLVSSQQPPVPRPFPQPGSTAAPPPQRPSQQPAPPTTATPPSTAAVPPAPGPVPGSAEKCAAPGEAFLGVPIYPGAQFLACYDAGRGQKFYLFGSATSFLDLVKYYRNVLKKSGDLVFDAPATHEFEVGRFREETMAFPPGVTIKEFKSEISDGYPNPIPNAQPARFPTIIQIVPVTEK